MVHDTFWLEGLRRGDADSCAELIRLYERALYTFVRQMGLADADAQDIVQETFIRIWKNIHNLREINALTTWTYRICLNVVRAHLNRLAKAYVVDAETSLNDIPDAHSLTNDSEKVELRLFIRKLIEAQPPEGREILVLHYFHGLSLAECAQILELSAGTVKSRLSRMFPQLKSTLIERGFVEGG